jgi:hypothetical protein
MVEDRSSESSRASRSEGIQKYGTQAIDVERVEVIPLGGGSAALVAKRGRIMKVVDRASDDWAAESFERSSELVGERRLPRAINAVDRDPNRVRPFDFRNACGEVVEESSPVAGRTVRVQSFSPAFPKSSSRKNVNPFSTMQKMPMRYGHETASTILSACRKRSPLPTPAPHVEIAAPSRLSGTVGSGVSSLRPATTAARCSPCARLWARAIQLRSERRAGVRTRSPSRTQS